MYVYMYTKSQLVIQAVTVTGSGFLWVANGKGDFAER